VHGFRLPGCAVLGVPDEEKQPGDWHLRLDVDFDAADPGSADLSGRADLPHPAEVGRWRRGDYTRTRQ